jgi:hypothetical protein
MLSRYICQNYRDIAESRYRRRYPDSIGLTCRATDEEVTDLDIRAGRKNDLTINWDREDQSVIVERVVEELVKLMRSEG